METRKGKCECGDLCVRCGNFPQNPASYSLCFHCYLLLYPADLCKCGGEYQWQNYCGAKVCGDCGDHKGLARCYCGWGLAPGERLEDDVED